MLRHGRREILNASTWRRHEDFEPTLRFFGLAASHRDFRAAALSHGHVVRGMELSHPKSRNDRGLGIPDGSSSSTTHAVALRDRRRRSVLRSAATYGTRRFT